MSTTWHVTEATEEVTQPHPRHISHDHPPASNSRGRGEQFRIWWIWKHKTWWIPARVLAAAVRASVSVLARSLVVLQTINRRSCIISIITEKAPTRSFSCLKAATTAFTFKTLLRHYAKRVSQREIGSTTQLSGTGGLVSIVSYSRPSLMIIASWTQFHVERPWGQRPFSIVS